MFLVDRNRSRSMFTSLRARVELGEEERSKETCRRKHDEGAAHASTSSALEYDAGAGDEALEKEGPMRHRLSPVQVQQQALIRRIRTLETRRDWRGVLAAMVGNGKLRLCALQRGLSVEGVC